MRLKRFAACLLVLAMLAAFLPASVSAETGSDLLSLVDDVTLSDGSFRVPSAVDLYVVGDDAPQGTLLSTLTLSRQQLLAGGVISQCDIVYGGLNDSTRGNILVFSDPELPAEAYRLTVSETGISVFFGLGEKSAWYGEEYDCNGLLYGLNMLQKLLTVYDGELPCMTLSDEPDTPERTVMLDCARKYWTVAWIENLIAQMSWLGYNSLELHLAEDQGIRCDIWSDGSDCNGNDYRFLIGYDQNWNKAYPDPNASRFYTAEDLRTIAEFARLYHIEIIPDYDVPSHCDVLTKRYEAYASEHPEFKFLYDFVRYTPQGTYDGNTVTAYPEGADFTSLSPQSTHSCVDVTNPVARAFSLSVVEAYASFFAKLGCTKFNLGCDELSVKASDGWEAYAHSHIKGGATATDTLVDYINEADTMLNSRGYTDVRVFNDVLYHDGKRTSNLSLNEDISVCIWSVDTPESVEAIAQENRPMFNCIQNYCYYVLRCNDEKNGGDARSPDNTWWAFHHSTPEKIYAEWSPCRMYNADCAKPKTDSVRGGYFLIWGDFGGYRTELQVWNGEDGSGLYNLIDRLWSNSVKMWAWDAQSRLDYKAFSAVRDSVRLHPGFSSTDTAPSTQTVAPISMGRIIQFTAEVGGQSLLLGSTAVKSLDQVTVRVPVFRGYHLMIDGLLFTPDREDGMLGMVTLSRDTNEITFAANPDVSELRLLLADRIDTKDPTYLHAYGCAEAFYAYLQLPGSAPVSQDVIDRAADALRMAKQQISSTK